MTERNKRGATSAEIIAIHRRLSELLNVEPNGYVSYKEPGHSDKSIAAELSVPAGSVRRVRNENFGKLREFRMPGDNAKIEELQQHCDALGHALHDLTQRFDKLCLALSLAKVVDVRHLTTQKNGDQTPLKAVK